MIAVLVALVGSARADAPVATATKEAPDPESYPHLVGDVRAVLLIRSDDNYFQHATRFGYDFPSEAGGVAVTLGAAISPRVALLAEGLYVEDGSDRGLSRLRLVSGALLGVARVTLMRAATHGASAELSANVGFGRYFLRETYVDPELSPTVYSNYAGSYGGVGGLEGAVTVGVFRLALVYGYHYAPAAVDDRIRGSVEAGGHELSLAVGVSL